MRISTNVGAGFVNAILAVGECLHIRIPVVFRIATTLWLVLMYTVINLFYAVLRSLDFAPTYYILQSQL